MSDERVRYGQNSHLIYGIIDLHIIRYMIKMLSICSHGHDDLPIRFSQRMDAVAIKLTVLIYCSHGNIDGFFEATEEV